MSKKKVQANYPRRLRDDIRHVMSTSRGRRLMHALIFERQAGFGCDLLARSYSGHANDTAFHEGKREVGRELLSLLQVVTPRDYAAMMAEMLQEDMERRGETDPEETLDE